MEKICGTVDTIIFASQDNRFTVLKLSPEKLSTQITVTLNGIAPLIGQLLEIEGEWVKHPKFGQQFKATTYKTVAPTEISGIEKFLASGAINGIGPAMAKKIVAEFGEKTLEIIAKSPNELLKVPGIGKKTAEKISASYLEQSELTEIMVWLENHGISNTYAGKIFAKYGSFAIDIMEKDIYRLFQDIEGIGFLTADKLAFNLGIQREDKRRIISGIDYALMQLCNNGHCCIPEMALVDKTAKILQVNNQIIFTILKERIDNGSLNTEVVGGETLIYPPYLYYAEKKVAMRLLQLQQATEPLSEDNLSLFIKVWEKDNQIQLAQKQKEAIKACLHHGVLVLTGGPGTGKTTVIKGILSILKAQGLKIRLAAPTGRAAKRLSETTGQKALTIHRLLEANNLAQDDNLQLGFSKDIDDQLDADVIILDEVSMVDIVLMHHFLNAVPDGCRIILVGDTDQLPAVGPGSVLKDIIRSQKIPAIRLDEIFRQAQTSMIIQNAHIINAGRLPDLRKQYSDFVFYELNDDTSITQKILDLCTKDLPHEGFNVLKDVQVLSPMHRFLCGVENLNLMLQEQLNPKKNQDELKYSSQTFRVGDKVMHIRNNYQKNVFNGDIGFIQDINNEKLTVDYFDHIVTYEKNELNELTLAYASSVHKSQGSEYKVVIIPLSTSHYIMLQRNLLYTAITRAKQKVIIIGSKKALMTAVQSNRTQKRYTLLAERLAHKLI
ncbi:MULTISPECIES: ATP-dependent RecD-like DNA helicase [Megamonas]|jgi:exodeoxyribonuclease V alpha subunit|uniref:ATP-dependent RecD2 DNA helicase n=1 Tax=Megamonas funiformis TaxID=437897 RepID=A0AAW4U961_9FIRM|nr:MULTISPECIES: ATP-dependent RecD-like DNA helicase [Megamonas]MBD9295734.1 ATP-dependent RecD-like DNA helicase [Megamonas funiformis]MBS7211539.1 ATP-dependent RecD-like DNA helicase [Megamonas funiformis]MCB6828445.1 ATP-dependent RecD-like DNA helicase [Megamonas funiformis]